MLSSISTSIRRSSPPAGRAPPSAACSTRPTAAARPRDDLSHEERADLNASLEQPVVARGRLCRGRPRRGVFSRQSAVLSMSCGFPAPVRNGWRSSLAVVGRWPAWSARALVRRVGQPARDARLFRGSPDGCARSSRYPTRSSASTTRAAWPRPVTSAESRRRRTTTSAHGRVAHEAPQAAALPAPGGRGNAGGGGPTSNRSCTATSPRASPAASRSTWTIPRPSRCSARPRPCFDALDVERDERRWSAWARGPGRPAASTTPARPQRAAVETLLSTSSSPPRCHCPECGWLGGGDERTCPVEAASSAARRRDRRGDRAGPAGRSEIMAMRHCRADFEERAGGIAALLRF